MKGMTMDEQASKLTGKHILVVEDEYFIASDLKRMLEENGVTVIGPVGSTVAALSIIAEQAVLDAAVLDISLDATSDVYPVAQALRARNVPFVFATGYDQTNVRNDFADVPHFNKPFDLVGLGDALF